MSKSERDEKALRAIGYSAHVSVERVNEAAGKAAVARLEKAGLVERDSEWTGCLVLTGRGRRRLSFLDA